MNAFSSGAMWICGEPYAYGEHDADYYGIHRNHVLVRAFSLDSDSDLTLHIAVLGYARVTINGRRASADELVGDWTNYTKLVLWRSYDVGDLVHAGANEIRIELGNGWYNPAPLTLFGKYNLRERLAEVGTPSVMAELVDAEGTVVLATDESWSWVEGQLTFNNLYLGERADLTLSESAPRPVVATPNTRTLEPSSVAACVRAGELEPVASRQTEAGLLLDFGKIVSGFISLEFAAHAGDVVTLSFAEALGDDGLPLYEPNLAGLVGQYIPEADVVVPGGPGAPERAIERDEVVCREGKNRFENTFCYHSFRYVLIEGLASDALCDIRAIYVHTGMAQAGAISIGNERLQDMHEAAIRTKLNNIHGVWEDCARERLGYGGDMVALATSNLLSFDCEGLIRKTVRDFRNDQTAAGGVPETAPFMGIQSNGTGAGEGPLLWQLAYPYLCVKAYQWYGARDLVEREWPYLKRLADYLLSRDPEELSAHCLGDHGSVQTGDNWKAGTPDKEFAGWCTILWHARLAARLAGIAGEDPSAYERAAEGLANQVRARFCRADGTVGDGTQTAYAFAGALGIVDAAQAADAIAASVKASDGVLSTGIFGTMLAFDLLHDNGYDSLVENWLLRDDEPSFSHMLASGSGVLAEQFYTKFSSLNHAMFSSYVMWLYQSLAGVRVADDAVCSDKLDIRPFFSDRTNRVSAELRLRCGVVRSSWVRSEGKVEFSLEVPEGVEARVTLPEGAALADERPGGTRRWVIGC